MFTFIKTHILQGDIIDTKLHLQKTYALNTSSHWWKKSKMTQIDGNTYHALGLEESILSKWLCYLRQSTDSMQSLSITKDIFHRTRTKYFKVCLEVQKTQNSQRRPEKEKWSWRNQAPGLQTILQSNSHQNRMVLAQRQKYRSVELDREPRIQPTHLQPTNLWQRRQEYTIEKGQLVQ